jgi:chaperonin GroEL (HSP60 family)
LKINIKPQVKFLHNSFAQGTVLIKTAEELKNFSRGEETQLENQFKAIKESGADVVVAAGKFGDMALHYLNKYDLMGVRLTSKFDLRRLCKATNGTALPRLVKHPAACCNHVVFTGFLHSLDCS